MRKIIYKIDLDLKVFYVIHEGQRLGFYLSNKLYKTFFDYLKPGVLVDFEITDKQKKMGHLHFYQIAFFNQIISLNPHQVHYDLFLLRDEMKRVLKGHKYFLFVDFEMTMPGYSPVNFRPEIIQVGYVLAKAKQDIIKKNGYYVLPEEMKVLSKRTKKFLNLDEEVFMKEAKPFMTFYDELKDIMKTYKPMLVVWGKNDRSALNDAYQIHHVKPLTKDDHFIDLLKLHKDYYNLKDDLGLFKAYKTYYEVPLDQAHDAMDDALITKYVFDAFLDYIE